MVAQHEPSMRGASALLRELRKAGIDVDATLLTRSLYAHDASNYRVTPTCVAFPRNAAEVALIARACSTHGIPMTARGAGTGMAGNSIGTGVILEFRRSMSGIVDIDVGARTVRVEPGIILDALQTAVAPFGLMFGPDPSSHSRATIGGMIGNDACGNHSVAYGRTGDHVVELELVLADGTRAVATRTGLRALDPSDAARLEQLTRHLEDIAATSADVLRTEFDRGPRQVSGYAAHRLLPELGFDIARLLVGSEGSLAIVVAATLALVEVPTQSQLLVLGYRDLIDAARDLPLLLEQMPAAIEAVDRAIVDTLRARRGDEAVPALPAGDAWLYVEFADTIRVANVSALAEQVLDMGNAVSGIGVHDPQHRAALWRLREEGAGLASNLLDGTRGRPGWEDAAVPPHRLAEYLSDLRALQQKHGFTGVLYGHFGAGCVHVRFDFETASVEGRRAMGAFIREAAVLVARCGGSVSGEHGDGRARGELLPLMYSPATIGAFTEIKRAFDPSGLLNPGTIVAPQNLEQDMPSRRADVGDAFLLDADRGDLGFAADRCVGVGRCVTNTISAMCPTYGVTGEERDGTRGRARIVQDLFNDSGVTTTEALRTLDGCLACRACASDCPTGVDVTTYKAELLQRHYRTRLRPRAHFTLGRLPQFAGVLARIAPIANRMLSRPRLRRPLAGILGISPRRFPTLATRDRRPTMPKVAAPDVLLYADPVTLAFAPDVVDDARRVLHAAGVTCRVIAPGDTGLSLISTGQLRAAKRVQRRLVRAMRALPDGIPVVALEPSAAATLAHDLPRLLDDPGAQAVAQRVRTFAQALWELAPTWTPAHPLPRSVVLQPHCHERSVFAGPTQADWLRAHGSAVQEAVGCCGMGGNFGYEPGHASISIAVAERSLVPAIDLAPPGSVMLADGFGCRCQVEDLRPTAAPQHLASLLASLL